MSHANAALTPIQRLRIGKLIVDDGWPVAHAAVFFPRLVADREAVGGPVRARWARRGCGSGRHIRTDPRTARRPGRWCVSCSCICGGRSGSGRSRSVGSSACRPRPCTRCCVRCRLHRLRHVDIRTGEPVRRYEHDHPGSMIHVDVKKLGNIPDGGGWRTVGRQQGNKHRAATPGKARSKNREVLMRHAFVHTVIDDHSRVAYAEIHDDETAVTAIGVLRRATSWFAARGVTVERVLSDNGSAYRSHAWRDTCAELGIRPKRTRPYRPQTNGKLERFHRTLADGWAFSRHYNSESARRNALPAWLHHYNHHRPHTAIGKVPPISRLTNLPGQYS